jgi:hypothetical protein
MPRKKLVTERRSWAREAMSAAATVLVDDVDAASGRP